MAVKTIFFNVNPEDFAEIFSEPKVISAIENIFSKVLNERLPPHLTENPQKIVDIETLCQQRKLIKQTVYSWVSNPKIDFPHFKRGKRLYFDLDEVDSWLKAGRRESFNDFAQKVNTRLVEKYEIKNQQ